MKGEAQANAMCVCVQQDKEDHTLDSCRVLLVVCSNVLLLVCSSVLLVVCSVGDHREDEHVPLQS